MKEIVEQLHDLHLCLQWSTAHPNLSAAYTTGERIMINHERAALLRALDGEFTSFTQSPDIITRTLYILNLIKRTKWVPIN